MIILFVWILNKWQWKAQRMKKKMSDNEQCRAKTNFHPLSQQNNGTNSFFLFIVPSHSIQSINHSFIHLYNNQSTLNKRRQANRYERGHWARCCPSPERRWSPSPSRGPVWRSRLRPHRESGRRPPRWAQRRRGRRGLQAHPQALHGPAPSCSPVEVNVGVVCVSVWCGWRCVEVDGSVWEWMEVDGNGWKWEWMKGDVCVKRVWSEWVWWWWTENVCEETHENGQYLHRTSTTKQSEHQPLIVSTPPKSFLIKKQ